MTDVFAIPTLLLARLQADERTLLLRRKELANAGATISEIERLLRTESSCTILDESVPNLLRRARHHAATARAERRALLSRSAFPERHLRHAWDTAPNRSTAIGAARAWERQDLPFLVLLGPTGTGKTLAGVHSGCNAVEQLDDDAVRSSKSSVLFLRASELARLAGYSHEDSWANVLGAQLLVLDDVGAEFSDANGWHASALDRLVDHRYAAVSRTVITSNLAAHDFASRVGQRVFDRIREAAVVHHITGPSLRRIAPKGAPSTKLKGPSYG